MMLYYIIASLLLVSVHGLNDEGQEYEELLDVETGRIFDNVFNLSSLSLPTLGAILASGLLGLLTFLAFANQGASASGSSQGYGQQQSSHSQGYGQRNDQYSYKKRSGAIDDFTNQLYLLAEAFQKYEIEETGCQLYVACESSNVSKHQKNGRLAKLVYEVMSNLKTSENEDLYKDDQYMKDLMSAFKIGSIGSDCSKFRQMCRTEKVF